MIVNVNTQRTSSVVRQICAIASVVVGALQSSSVLPGSAGPWLVLGGSVLLWIEHYVSDPSTGTTNAQTVKNE